MVYRYHWLSRHGSTLQWPHYWPITPSHRCRNVISGRVSMRCRDPTGQSAFFVPVSPFQTFNWIYCYRQFAVGMVDSAIAVFRLVDNILSSSIQIVHWRPNYKLDSLANSNRDTCLSPLYRLNNKHGTAVFCSIRRSGTWRAWCRCSATSPHTRGRHVYGRSTSISF